METQKIQPETQPPLAVATPLMPPCRIKKRDDATFWEDVRDHIDEFIHASMEEHKNCLKKSIHEMFGMSKVVTERTSDTTGVESSLPKGSA